MDVLNVLKSQNFDYTIVSGANSSYFDWEQQFKPKIPNLEPFNKNTSETTNSLGIKESEFKKYLSEWRKRNI